MINPLKTHLHILQLEGYSPSRFFSWWLKHPFTLKTTPKKPLTITPKIKLITSITLILYLSLITISITQPISILLFILLLIEPFPLIFASLIIIKPYEIIRRCLTKISINKKITQHPHLTTIGITGSYGKTSTKDILFQIIDEIHPTLKTPESYNTLFGIAKTINLELHPKLKYFICEFGAYSRGEIKELTQTIPPQYAILTAIGTQHLERFKSLKNTTLAKFELIDSTKPENCLVNLDNKLIQKQLNQNQYKNVKTYSTQNPKADFFVSKYTLTNQGTDFTLRHNHQSHHFHSSLFGTSNLENLTAAISLSIMLGIKPTQINKSINQMYASPHRLELKKINQATLIDNSYSSNQQGITNIINDLHKPPGKKAIITPGIIELGQKTEIIHQKIGHLIAPVFDTAILVEQSNRTRALEIGIKNHPKSKTKIQFLNNQDSVWPTIETLSKTHQWILLENDLPDNF